VAGRIPGVDGIESALRRLGSAFVAGLRQPGYQLITVSEHGRRAQSYTMAGEPALLGRWFSMDLDEAMSALSTIAGSGMAIELIGDPQGDYIVHWTRDPAPARIVLDAGYRFPGHERPPLRQPAPPDRRPTDPAVLAEMRELVARFVDRHHGEGYAPGYSEDEILAAEQQLGVRLPEDLRALYRIVHDDREESGLLDPFVLAPLDVVVEWNKENHPGYHDGTFDDPLILDCHPAGHVRRVSSSGGWLTFATDYGMNYGVVDLDPGPLGRHGQVLTYGRDVWAPVEYVLGSVRDLLERAIAAVDEEHPGPPSPQWRADLSTGDLAGLVAAVEDPALVQIAEVHEASEIRLADLSRFPHLRSIAVRDRADRVDMTLPPGLPIERLHVAANHFDPATLAAASGLRYLTLSGNTSPVPVAALAALPDLLRLDLSGAAVADIEALAGFPALRMLTLNGRQWTTLLSVGRLPATLAAVSLGGTAGVADGVRWQQAFGRAATLHTLRGEREQP
jgi:cell wall assembly regulator SMI1